MRRKRENLLVIGKETEKHTSKFRGGGRTTIPYINECVPEEEKRSFLILRYKRERTVGKWTIDKEKDYLLFKYSTDRDNPVDEYFAFVYKGRVIDMILDGSEFVDLDTIEWKITRISIPEDLDREEVHRWDSQTNI